MDNRTTQMMFSSENQKWETRPEFIQPIKKVFPFALDVCASRPNICNNYYDEKQDGLIMPWRGLCWMNSPYGREGPTWLERAIDQTAPNENGVRLASVLAICPAKPGTNWFQDTAQYASQVTFIRGRVKFGSNEYWSWLWKQKKIKRRGRWVKNPLYLKSGRIDPAPFDSAFLMFGDFTTEQFEFISGYGMSFRPGDLFNPPQ